MRASIIDHGALVAVTPTALSAYASVAGWTKGETYGENSDLYVAESLPEIILPRTQQLGDYANVVSQLIGIFAEAVGKDELSLYRELVTADRDTIRVRAYGDGVEWDGSVAVDHGLALMNGARDMLLAAACSLVRPRAFYRPKANKFANRYLDRVRLGQTEQGSFVVTLLSPAVPLRTQQTLDMTFDDDPLERRVTKRLAQALTAVRETTKNTGSRDTTAVSESVGRGVSVNLCKALGQLIEPFPKLDIGVVWARTRPMKKVQEVFHFTSADAPILNETTRALRGRGVRFIGKAQEAIDFAAADAPASNETVRELRGQKREARLFGFVRRPGPGRKEPKGTILLRTLIDGQDNPVTVNAVLQQSDYLNAIRAFETNALLVVEGNIERVGDGWRLSNPKVTGSIEN